MNIRNLHNLGCVIKPFRNRPIKHFIFELLNNQDALGVKKYLSEKIITLVQVLLIVTCVIYSFGDSQNAYIYLISLPVILSCFMLPPSGAIMTSVIAALLVGPWMLLRVEGNIYQQFFQWGFQSSFLVIITALASSLIKVRNKMSSQMVDISRQLDEYNMDLELKIERRTQELLSKNQKLEILDRERKTLLHMLCHDLHNPLSGIHETVMTLLDGKSLENNRDLEKLILECSENGLDIIRVVSEFEFFETRRLELSIESVRLSSSVKNSIKMLRHKFKEKDIHLKVDVDLNSQIKAEETTLVNMVLSNIFTNAIKFSHRGSKIIIKSTRHKDIVMLSIRDHGIGIPNGCLKNIFTIGSNITRKGTEGETGTGFGMPLVKKFVNLYGGNIEIVSKERREDSTDHGTEIILTFEKV